MFSWVRVLWSINFLSMENSVDEKTPLLKKKVRFTFSLLQFLLLRDKLKIHKSHHCMVIIHYSLFIFISIYLFSCFDVFPCPSSFSFPIHFVKGLFLAQTFLFFMPHLFFYLAFNSFFSIFLALSFLLPSLSFPYSCSHCISVLPIVSLLTILSLDQVKNIGEKCPIAVSTPNHCHLIPREY